MDVKTKDTDDATEVVEIVEEVDEDQQIEEEVRMNKLYLAMSSDLPSVRATQHCRSQTGEAYKTKIE